MDDINSFKLMPMKNINIPEPCSEDWSEMTPNEKGAFCRKCALDVYDFTNKSADEIREVLTLNMASPVCMRIESKQLEELNSDFSAWKINKKHSYQHAWAFTLLVVFGMTLFSCEEDEEPVIKEYQKIGQIILNQEGGKKIIDPLGTFNTEVQSTKLKNVKSDAIEEMATKIENEVVLLDDARYVPQIQEYDEEVMRPIEKQRAYSMAGLPRMSPDYDFYLLETHPGIVSEVDSNVLESKIDGFVYPNPASTHTTLKLNMSSRGKGEIKLFALSGQEIRTIHSGRLKKGKNEFSIDLINLEAGMYLVVVHSDEMKETFKFTKIL